MHGEEKGAQRKIAGKVRERIVRRGKPSATGVAQAETRKAEDAKSWPLGLGRGMKRRRFMPFAANTCRFVEASFFNSSGVQNRT